MDVDREAGIPSEPGRVRHKGDMLLTKHKRLRILLGLLETASWLSVKLWIKSPRNARLFPGSVFRTYMGLVGREKWTCKSIFDAFPDLEDTRIEIHHLPGGGVHASLEARECWP